MPDLVTRSEITFQSDPSRVIARFLFTTAERSKKIISSILGLPAKEQEQVLARVLRRYSKRHRNILRIFERHFNRLEHLLEEMDIKPGDLEHNQKMLIGAYFTMEYSIEAAAFFNPSVVEDPDQTAIGRREKRIILSFRATGEGHISSLVFRSAIINKHNEIIVEPPGRMLDSPEYVRNHFFEKAPFLGKLREMQPFSDQAYQLISEKLTDTFTYEELKRHIADVRQGGALTEESALFLNEAIWLASSHYEMDFSLDTDISERVIFPIADTEKNGIEDARFVRFVDDDGSVAYYATYTAYDGVSILPKLLVTTDFHRFKVLPIHGEVAQNKGMALFPRKIKGKYAMLCRADGVNNYIAFSDNINVWRTASLLQSPAYPWEFVQIGNCGSPIETEKGWIVITHGVGPMREYVLGASLLDLENPEKEIARLKTPLLVPNQKEREGYVPNVVYSCGSIIHNDHLIIPYAMSDQASTYAIVNLQDLFARFESGE